MPTNAAATAPSRLPPEGRARAVVEGITPNVDMGRFAAKRVAGDTVVVEADCFTDGHDVVACRVLHRRDDQRDWQEAPMRPLGNGRGAKVALRPRGGTAMPRQFGPSSRAP